MDNPAGMDRLAIAAEKYIKQDRWSRRFTNFLKFAIAIYILFSIGFITQQVIPDEELSLTEKHVAIVKLEGAIMPQTKTSADVINPLLREAFSSDRSNAVIIKANSPGGSPVQSALINDEINRLKNKYNKPVYVVVQDMCASGCYYIAVAADAIYANKGSMVGSIGVRMDTFGVTSLMEKMGIENRSMHAGEHKAFIDPFSEKNEEGRAFFKEHVLERTHQQFIEVVKDGRGDKLMENENTFTGLVWLGDEAVKLGLIDGLGDTGFVQREILENDVSRVYESEKSVMEQLMGDISSETASRLSLYLSGMK